MKRYLFLLGILLTLPSVSAAKSLSVEEIKLVGACKEDSECVVAENLCGTHWIAINRSRSDDYQEYLSATRPAIKCQPVYVPLKPASAQCVASQCTVKE